eukprot:Gb_29874 [translate_table: standard]
MTLAELQGYLTSCMHTSFIKRLLINSSPFATRYHSHFCIRMRFFYDLRQSHTLQIQLEEKPIWVSNTNCVPHASLLQACISIKTLKQIHAHMLITGLEQDVYLGTKLVNSYAKCGSLKNARLVFDRIHQRNAYLWTMMIRGYAMNGPYGETILLYYLMQQAGIEPNNFTFSFVLKACASLSALQEGKEIHCHVLITGFETNVYVGTALIDMYAKCRSVENARQVFDRMSRRDVVSWNAMIAGYAQNGHAYEPLTLFHQMEMGDAKPDLLTMASVLQACAHLGALKQGKYIHDYINKNGLESDVFVGTALIDMYAKCGSVGFARQVFDKMHERDVASWSAMIAGYGMHGHGEDALELFSQMRQRGVKPDHITFVCVLSACSHAGLVDEGWKWFECMRRDYCITPRSEHYACMVDLLGRAGRLNEAEDFIQKMPLKPDADVWGALLGACRIHGNIQLGERVAERLFNLKPKKVGYYTLLSNIYASAGRWDDVAKVRTMIKDKGLKKAPGSSFIEVNNRVHAFLV